MIIEDDNTPTDELDSGPPDTDTHEGDGAVLDGQATPPTDEQALDAFKSGADEVSQPAEPAADVKDAADVVAAVKPVAPAPPAEPEPTDVDKAVAAKLESDKAIAKEMKDLHLDARSRAGARFREMANNEREMAPFKPVLETLAKSGIKDVDGVNRMLDTAARGVEWEDSVLRSTATPEQFGGAMTVIKCMNSNDPKLLNVAFDEMGKQYAALGAKLGREVPGLVDPLDAHPDLKEQVEDQDITRKAALEIARMRVSEQLTEQGRQQNGAQEQQRREWDDGLQAINALSAQLQANDPQFAQKLAIITPKLAAMRNTVHPSQWASQAATLYATTFVPVAQPAPAPAPRRLPVSNVPARHGIPSTTLRRDPENDYQAFRAGVDALRDST